MATQLRKRIEEGHIPFQKTLDKYGITDIEGRKSKEKQRDPEKSRQYSKESYYRHQLKNQRRSVIASLRNHVPSRETIEKYQLTEEELLKNKIFV